MSNELHDLLLALVVLPLPFIDTEKARDWPLFYERLVRAGRVHTVELGGTLCWVATERMELAARRCFADENSTVTNAEACLKCVQGWLQITGPVSSDALAKTLGVGADAVYQSFLAMEMQGLLLRGVYEYPPPAAEEDQHLRLSGVSGAFCSESIG